MVVPHGLPAEIVPVIVRTVAGRHLVIECYGRLLLRLLLRLRLLLHAKWRPIAVGRRVQVGGDRVVAVDVAGAQVVGRIRGGIRAGRMVVVVIDEHGSGGGGRQMRSSGHVQRLLLRTGRAVEQRRIGIVVQIGGVLVLMVVGGRQHSGLVLVLVLLVVDVRTAAIAAMEVVRRRQRKLGGAGGGGGARRWMHGSGGGGWVSVLVLMRMVVLVMWKGRTGVGSVGLCVREGGGGGIVSGIGGLVGLDGRRVKRGGRHRRGGGGRAAALVLAVLLGLGAVRVVGVHLVGGQLDGRHRFGASGGHWSGGGFRAGVGKVEDALLQLQPE